MTLRHCPRCSAEVDTTDGFCLLGHTVKLVPPVERPGHLPRALNGDVASDPVRTGPPPPPPDGLGVPPIGFGTLSAGRNGDRPVTDPIASFAPYPRMDWGPKRLWRRSEAKRLRG